MKLFNYVQIIEVSLSEPHTDEFAAEFVHIIYHTSCRKSLPALILRVLASFSNSKTIHQHAQWEGTNRRTSSMATARTETACGPIYSWLER